MNDKAYPKEVMAAVIAHGLRDGQWVEVGANLPVPRAGALLGHLSHGPNMTVMLAMTKAYLADTPVIEEFEFITDVGAMRWAEAYYQHDQLLNNQRHRANGVFFCGGIQIDRFGNSNMIGIGDDYSKLKFRGPGAIGTTNATVQNGTWHLVTNSHDARVLVDRVAYISAVGYGRGEPNLREELGLPNAGPRSIITPLCVFDFDEETHSARLKSVHPDVSVDEVIAATGFEIVIPDSVPVTEGPTAEELELLRSRIDTQGAFAPMIIDRPEFRNLPALLERNAAEDPDRVFLAYPGGELSRGQVWESAQRAAAGFLAHGLARGDRVGIMLDNGPEFISAWFGLATAGIVEVPLNPGMGRERLLHALRNSGVAGVVTDIRYLAQFDSLRTELPTLRLVVTVGGIATLEGIETVPLAEIESFDIGVRPVITRADTVAIMYTSGSTGPAKGVILPHGQHYTNGWQATRQADIRPDDRIFVVLPLHHNQAQGYGVMAALVARAEVFIAPAFRRATFWQEVADARATIFVFVGSLLALLGAQDGSPVNPIRVAFGAMVPRHLHLEMEERFGMRIIDAYGSTEGTIPVWGGLDGEHTVGSAGKVIPEFEVTIRGEDDEEVGVGEVGEICIRSREPYSMFQGYFANPEKTVAAWRNFWFHSGDRGRFDGDGNLWFEGRIDDVIRRFGEFIAATEVEEAVLTLDEVELVACYGIASDVVGQEVMVAIVLREGRALSPEDVRARVAEILPGFAVPRFIDFVGELPMTPTGKVEKHRLRARGVPETAFDARRALEGGK